MSASSLLPFLTPHALRSQGLPVPNRKDTPAALPALTLGARSGSDGPHELAQSPPPDLRLLAYQKLYGLDQLPSMLHQGHVLLAGQRIHVQVHQPQGSARGTVWVIHGYLEHSGLYQPLMAELLAEHFAVVLFDLPGHGLSEGAEASIHEFADYQILLDDLWNWARAQPRDTLPAPWLGVGQSTGGAIWLDHALSTSRMRQTPMVERLLLLSPLVHPAKSAWWHNPVGIGLLRRIRHNVPRAFRRNNHNPAFLRFVRHVDPLQSRVMGMAWILALSRWMPYMQALPSCRVPVWVAQGARDQTVDWRHNIEFIRRKCRLQAFLLLEEGSHQLINERADIRQALTALIPAFLHPAKENP